MVEVTLDDLRDAALDRVDALADELAAAIREALVADAEMYRTMIRAPENGGGLVRHRIAASLHRITLAQEPPA